MQQQNIHAPELFKFRKKCKQGENTEQVLLHQTLDI